MVNSRVAQGGPRQRDDRGAQRVRDGREQSRRRALPAHAAARLPLAQLRQSDHRRARRHREGADRQAAGVLPHLVPAGQRGAARRRPLRRSRARSRWSRKHFGADAKAGAHAAQLLHPGADAGRRARGDASARRRQPDGRRALSRAGRQPSRLPGDRRAGADPRRHAEPGGCTARWCRRAWPRATWGAERQLHDPGFMYFGAQLAKDGDLATARAALLATRRKRREGQDHRRRGRARPHRGC